MKTHGMPDESDWRLDPEAFDPRPDPHPPADPMVASVGPPPQPAPRAIALSLILRGVGALVIVAAFLLYLFEGWRDGDALSRSLLLLGHTAILTLVGVASGHLLHEAKGARLFIALALAAVPVNFAFLGGLTYAHLTWDPGLAAGAAASFWTVAGGEPLSRSAALTVTGLSLLALAVAIRLGFQVMARRSAGSLTALYLAGNATLLIPTRQDPFVSVALLGLGLVLAVGIIGLRRRDPSLATPEGVFARTLLVLPLLVLGGRTLWLYAPDTLFFTTLSLAGYLMLRMAAAATPTESNRRGALEGLALLLAALAAALALLTLSHVSALPGVAKTPLAAGLLAALLVDLSTLRGAPVRGLYRGLAAGLTAAAQLFNLAVFGGFGTALVALSVGILILVYAYDARSRLLLVTGLVTALLGLGVAAAAAFSDFSLGGWSTLVLLGIATILTASLVERHGAAMGATLGRWKRHFDRGR